MDEPTDTVVVGGSVAQRPQAGGHSWALSQWAAGLRQTGYAVTFLDPGAQGPSSGDDALSELGVDQGEPQADPNLVLNIMGFVPREKLPGDQTCWTFLDIDPGYPQMWRELGLVDMLAGHDRFVTIGENIGREDCLIPGCGLDWLTTPPPVVLDAWPVVPPGHAFTTVCTWRNTYGTVTWNGDTYGSRVHEFRKFFELPRLVDVPFELALDIDAAEADDVRALEENGWRLRDPKRAAGTPSEYRSYIQGSLAEFSVAQNMYVATRSGWLSDRSLCYLASGRPVLAQDTGFSDNYPVGEGLLAYSTLDEAAAGVEEIQRNYERHSRAARELAEEFFDAAKVLGRLLDRLGVAWGAKA